MSRTPRPTHPLSPEAFAFLGSLTRHLAGRRTAPSPVRDAVAVLTAAADPARAERLRPGANEPAVLVERLAVWALHRTEPEVIRAATHLLDRHVPATPPGLDTVVAA